MSLALSELSEAAVGAVLDAGDAGAQQRALAAALPALPRLSEDGNSDALLRERVHEDLLLVLKLGERLGWGRAQISCAVSIVKATLLASFFPGAGAAPLTQLQSFDLFSELVQRHAVDQPPVSSAVLSLAQVTALVEHVGTAVFRHYRSRLAGVNKPCAPQTRTRSARLVLPRPAPVPRLFGEGVLSREVTEYEPEPQGQVQ
jgi:hypothetical protein